MDVIYFSISKIQETRIKFGRYGSESSFCFLDFLSLKIYHYHVPYY